MSLISKSLLNNSILEIHQLLKSGQLNPIELFEACRQRIQETKILNCFITQTEDVAIKQANKAAQRFKNGTYLGILDGIPVSIKDNFCTQDVLTTCASKMLANYRPPFNATVVEKLLNNCGSVMMGKTNMDEFAMGSACSESYFGPTYHPWNSNLNFKFVRYMENNLKPETINSETNHDRNKWFITGGSSGGSAVSVAIGSSFASLSSDTGGSTRNPASRLGIVGYKPSYGVLSRFGLIPLTHSLDVPGIMARNVQDIEIIFSQLHGFDPKDSTTIKRELKQDCSGFDLKTVRVGIADEYSYDGKLSPSIEKAWSEAQKMLTKSGVQILPVKMPHTKYSLYCYTILNSSEVASNFACYDGIQYGHRTNNSKLNFQDCYSVSREESFNHIVKSRIIAGNYFLLNENYQNYYEKALKLRRLISEDFHQVFKQIDFLLTPVCITDTMNYDRWAQMDKTEEAIREDYCTQPTNMAGFPAISIPFKLNPDNHSLPIGLQLIGNYLDDYRLLRFAKEFQQMANCPQMILTS